MFPLKVAVGLRCPTRGGPAACTGLPLFSRTFHGYTETAGLFLLDVRKYITIRSAHCVNQFHGIVTG